jgi:hypothetical protein
VAQQIDAMQNRFERLADSIGSSGDALMGRLQEATNGMMTSAQLMESATGIMSLGLGKTEDQTVRLATVVGKLGWDMQQVILTFANNSKMRLDALGLSVEDVTQRAKELEKQGYSTDAAFDMAVIEAGEAKIELLGDASQTTAGKAQDDERPVERAPLTHSPQPVCRRGCRIRWRPLPTARRSLAESAEIGRCRRGQPLSRSGAKFSPSLNGYGRLWQDGRTDHRGTQAIRLGGDLCAHYRRRIRRYLGMKPVGLRED